MGLPSCAPPGCCTERIAGMPWKLVQDSLTNISRFSMRASFQSRNAPQRRSDRLPVRFRNSRKRTWAHDRRSADLKHQQEREGCRRGCGGLLEPYDRLTRTTAVKASGAVMSGLTFRTARTASPVWVRWSRPAALASSRACWMTWRRSGSIAGRLSGLDHHGNRAVV